MKIPNDLIKSTDYDKAKNRIIHEFKCVNGKIIHQYALGGEHEMTMQEIIDCLNAVATIDCDLQTAYAFIGGQEDKITNLKNQLALTEKALELACDVALDETIPYVEIEELKAENGIDTDGVGLEEILFYFKTKAKEMMESE